MAIPLPDMKMLPANAGYHARDGQANLDVRVSGDSIYITATCDSLAREVIRLTEELTRIRNDTELTQLPPKVINEPTGWQWFFIRLGQIAATALALIVARIVFKWYSKIKRSNNGQ